MRVMQLHIEELMRQSEQREKELQKTQAQLKEHAKQRAVQQPQERKLFARLEQLQAELKTARELRSKAEAHSVDLQQQLEHFVAASCCRPQWLSALLFAAPLPPRPPALALGGKRYF